MRLRKENMNNKNIRSISEIKKDIKNYHKLITSYSENLYYELSQAQDKEIKKLKTALNKNSKKWNKLKKLVDELLSTYEEKIKENIKNTGEGHDNT